MSNSFWWTLPPLPKQKRGKRPAEPGFTDEELQYLENTLQIVSGESFIVRSCDHCQPPAGMLVEVMAFLENILTYILGKSQIESISIDTLGLNETDAVHTRKAGADGARSSQSHNDAEAHSTARDRALCALSDARLWAVTHPNTVAVFLVFVASALLTRTNVGSIQALVGLACLFAGLKIMAATEDGFELPPRPRISTSQHLAKDQES